MTVCVFVVRDELALSTRTHTLSHIQTCMWLVGVFCPGCAVKGELGLSSISNQSSCT